MHEPFWKVHAIFDTKGQGGDFAYTVGLHERGLPELHMWARPSEGLDPGEDWIFNHQERGMVLNELAQSVVDGEIGLGDTVVKEFDGGAATVTFRLDQPVGREEVEAFAASKDALVVPIRWSLERAPDGPLLPVDDTALGEIQALLDALHAGMDKDVARSLPPRWRPDPDDVRFEPEQEFGPLTPLVRAYAAFLVAADADRLATFLERCMAASSAGMGPAQVLGLTAAQARPVGRRKALEHLRAASSDVVEVITGRSGPTRRWRDVMALLTEDVSPPQRKQAEKYVADLLHHFVTATLGTVAVLDVADEMTELAGMGPVVWGLSDTEAAPRGWGADEDVLASVRKMLDGLSLQDLAAMADLHRRHRTSSADYRGLALWLRGQQITSAVGLGSLSDVVPDSLVEAQVDEDRELILEALGVVTAAVACADRLSDEDRASFSSVLGQAIPTLSEVLDARAGGSAA